MMRALGGNCKWNHSDPITCLVGQPLPASSERDIQKHWNDYFVFSVTRNPLSRALSSYLMLHDKGLMHMANDSTVGPICYVPWRRFCKDPDALLGLCSERPGCCTW